MMLLLLSFSPEKGELYLLVAYDKNLFQSLPFHQPRRFIQRTDRNLLLGIPRIIPTLSIGLHSSR